MEISSFLLLIPFLLIRFGLLAFISKDAVQRAAHFAPMYGNELVTYLFYQISNLSIFVYLIFLKIKTDNMVCFGFGIVLYLLGIFLCAVSIIHFSFPSDEGLNINGIYHFSRNPMYIAYFICFIGMAVLCSSWVLFGIVLIFQISAHWIILAEERECIEKFGDSYLKYMKEVRRYI